VIDGATSLGGRTVQGAIFVLDQIVAVSRDQDLALLKFKVQDTPFLKLGSSANSVEGQKVLVIGNPEGFQGTVSDGIIAAFREGRSYTQITAPISPGSCGSPVLDESGQVIGLARLVYMAGQNLNFAISSETITNFLTRALSRQGFLNSSRILQQWSTS
jgi:serine protease Do